MNIPNAIEVLTDILAFVHPGDPPEEHTAIELAIESLERLKRCREEHCASSFDYLPGETPD